MAYELNGSNQFLTVPVDAAFDLGTGDFAVSVRVRFASFQDGVLIGLGDGANGGAPVIQCGWQLRYLNNNLYWYRYAHPIETFYTFSWTPSLNTWYQVTASRISGSLRAYVDSSQIGSTITTSQSYDRINTNNLHMGRGIFGNGTFYFSGQLSEAAVWKGAGLTAAEVEAISKGFTADQIRRQNLTFYAPLVRNLQDLRNNLTITNNNGATAATHPRIIT